MWYDDPFVKLKKRKRNRRRNRLDPILMVNARTLDVRRERLHRFGVGVLCLAALGALVWLTLQGGRWIGRAVFSHNARFIVRHFDLASDGQHVPAWFIRETAGLEEGMNLFAVDLGAIRLRLESVPRVERAQVQRILPDTLKVWVTERVAIARLGPGSTVYPMTVDRFGYLVGRSERQPSLPQITGTGELGVDDGKRASSPPLLDALKVLDLCDVDPALSRVLRVRRIDVSDVNFLHLYLDKDREAKVSRVDVEERLRDLATAVQRADVTGKAWKSFNFTVKRNPAVK